MSFCERIRGWLSPIKATDEMTQPVGQRDGQLYTSPVPQLPLITIAGSSGSYTWTAQGITYDGLRDVSVNALIMVKQSVVAPRPVLMRYKGGSSPDNVVIYMSSIESNEIIAYELMRDGTADIYVLN